MAIREQTKHMLDMLPPWIKMQDEDSIGARFLDVFGEQLEDMDQVINMVLNSMIIMPEDDGEDGVDIMSIDYIYRIKPHADVLDTSYDHTVRVYDGETIIVPNEEDSIYDFYFSDPDAYYYDHPTGTFYFRSKYDAVVINGARYDSESIILHHVWNPLDEIGLLFGCPRLVEKMETNAEYRVRLLDVFRNKGNSSKMGLANYISRSLGIDADKVMINSLDDDRFIASLMNEDGSAKKELLDYIKISKEVNGFGANTYWGALDDGAAGLNYLPMIWDLGLNDRWRIEDIQNGIGDTDDLQIEAPEQEDYIQEFSYNLYAEGLYYPEEKIYPEHRFKYKIYAIGKKYDDGYSPEVYKYTVTASDLLLLNFSVVANRIYEHHYRLNYLKVNQYTKFITTLADGVDIVANSHNFLAKDAKLTTGKYSTTEGRRYLQVMARMESDRTRLNSPKLRSINVKYKVDGVEKTVTIETEQDLIDNGDNTYTAGFEVNSWDDASPVLRVKNDTNDMYNTIVQLDGSLELGYGDYQKVYNSEGDWDDGMSNPQTRNVFVSPEGSLKLENTRIL